jgi:hypothetical protein
MKLALARREDFKRLWSIYRNADRVAQEYSSWEIDEALASMHVRGSNLTKLKRCLTVILGQLDYSGGFMRVVMGCELLIEHCQDPAEDVYALKPEIAQGYEDTARLEWMMKHGATVSQADNGVMLIYFDDDTSIPLDMPCENGQQAQCIRMLIDQAMRATAPAEANDAQ